MNISTSAESLPDGRVKVDFALMDQHVGQLVMARAHWARFGGILDWAVWMNPALSLSHKGVGKRSLPVGNISNSTATRSEDWRDMPLTDACRRLSRESRPQLLTNGQMLRGLEAHGITSNSPRPASNLYATLATARDFQRVGKGHNGKWKCLS